MTEPDLTIDISRTLSRLNRPEMTGIDRVETAYVLRLLKNPRFIGAFGRVGSHYIWLEPHQIHQVFEGARPFALGGVSLKDCFRFKLSPAQRRIKSYLRRKYGFISKRKLIRKLTRDHLRLYNVGHREFSRELEGILQKSGVKEFSFFIHDVIPLDHPEYARAPTIRRFKAFFGQARVYADEIITNSEFSAERIVANLEGQDIRSKIVTAPLGVEVPQKISMPSDGNPPLFLFVGTLEPRKNIDLLLQIWEKLSHHGEAAPRLYLIGQRGWYDEDFFKNLIGNPLFGKSIFWKSNVSDAELWGYYKKATALLFPSWVEGFGLPILEAAALDTPILCSDLPPFREILGNDAKFLCPDQVGPWVREIENLLERPYRVAPKPVGQWDDHFRTVGL